MTPESPHRPNPIVQLTLLRLRERVGVALQETRFPDRLSVTEILTLFRSFYPTPRPLDTLLGEVELEEKRTSWVTSKLPCSAAP